MKKIKVAQVITRMDWGGSSDIVRILCSRLEPEIYDARLITGLTRFPSVKTQTLFQNLKGRVTVVSQLRRDINFFFDGLAFLKLYWLFRKERFDIVHTHTAKAGALGRLAAAAAGVPVIIYTPHGNDFYGYFGPFLSRVIVNVERVLSRITTRITVFTELEKKDFAEFKVAKAEKICLIYLGLEAEEVRLAQPDRDKVKSSLGILPDEHAIGMVARLEPVKGPEFFVRAAAEAGRDLKKAKFVIVGEGSLRSRLEQLAGSLGIRERCIFTGWRNDASEIISALDILVLPSLNEGVGMVLLEAQSRGIPVIASAVGGVSEVVKDNYTGILVAPGNINGLAQAIKDLINDEGKRRQLGNNGQDWVRGRFSVKDMVTNISKLYGDNLPIGSKSDSRLA